MEIWLPHNSYYEISNFGQVRNRDSLHILAQNINSGGYLYVTLHNPKYNLTVSRGVAKLFVANPFNKEQVNHKDGIKLNNHYLNLEWVTQTENLEHAVSTGLMPSGSKSYLAKLNEQSVEEIKLAFTKGFNQASQAKLFNVDRGTINGIFKKRTWRHVRPDLAW